MTQAAGPLLVEANSKNQGVWHRGWAVQAIDGTFTVTYHTHIYQETHTETGIPSTHIRLTRSLLVEANSNDQGVFHRGSADQEIDGTFTVTYDTHIYQETHTETGIPSTHIRVLAGFNPFNPTQQQQQQAAAAAPIPWASTSGLSFGLTLPHCLT